jgi:hypothetical protein
MNSTLQSLNLETHPGRNTAQIWHLNASNTSNIPNLLWQVWLLAIAFNLTTMVMTAMEVIA